ncbi:TPA: helix-turn-helix transcriptional regulator [Serratia fonticola]|nr:helix-turn-helix transcriptional regulator [Serratia fonticola]
MRKKASLSQSFLAAELGLSQSDISKIEGYERRLDALELFEFLEIISRHLELPMDILWKDIYENISRSQ